MTLLETHSPALFIAHTIFALVGVGMLMTSTSFEAKGEIRKQTIQLQIKLSITIYKFFEKSSLPLDSLHNRIESVFTFYLCLFTFPGA
jgi:hypothetical protein